VNRVWSNRTKLGDFVATIMRCALVGLVFLAMAGCASRYIGGPLQTEDFLIPSRDPGVQLFVRNKYANDKTVFTGDRTVLFVHGATYPGEATFDLRVDGRSWMEYLAERGYDVYLMDVRGYGRSTRPPAMSQPAAANPPFAGTEEAVRDIEAAVNFILMRRSLTRLSLMGWSWGTTTTALYTTRNPERVGRLVLVAPVWTPQPGTAAPPAPTTAYRSVTIDAAQKRWLTGVPADKQASLIPAGWFQAWSKAILESDPVGAAQNPPVVRAPNGALQDIFGQWLAGKPMYDASKISVPTMLIKGEWDVDTPAVMAQRLFANLTNTPYKIYTEIGEGTHTLMLEKNRLQLFRAVQVFLDAR
jgi:pimeloyl-ACP methyl ester carboxylesterase